jgi:hypothetical protein
MIIYVEWFPDQQTYKAIRALLIPHPDIPVSYEEWLHLTANKIGDVEASGNTVQKVEVDPLEFSNYCYRKGLNCDTVALHHFAFFKGSGQEHS